MKVESKIVNYPALGEQFNGCDHKLYVTTKTTHDTYNLHVLENSTFKALNCSYHSLEELFARNSDILPNRCREVNRFFEVGDIIYNDSNGREYHVMMPHGQIRVVMFDTTCEYACVYSVSSLQSDKLLSDCNMAGCSWHCKITE